MDRKKTFGVFLVQKRTGKGNAGVKAGPLLDGSDEASGRLGTGTSEKGSPLIRQDCCVGR